MTPIKTTIRVLLLTRYPGRGASSRVRFLQYVPGLQSYGIEVDAVPFWDETYLSRLYGGKGHSSRSLITSWGRRLRALTRARHYDVAWIEKEIFPWGPAWIAKLASPELPIVLDLDDYWHLRYGKIANSFGRWLLKSQLEHLVRRARLVTVANPFLEDWAREMGAGEIAHVPSTVDLDRYKAAELPADGPFTIGWIGTPATAHYLEDIAAPLKRLLEDPKTRLSIIGASHFSLSGPRIELHPWSPQTEVELLRDISVGVMPLREGLWEKGKSAYKAIQYMAVGRPVVATPVGVAKELIRSEANGYFATNSEDWIAAIDRLRKDRALAAQLGRTGRADIENSYSTEAQLPHIADILRAAAGK